MTNEGQLAEELFGDVHLPEFDFLFAHRGDWGGRGEVGVADQRTGDDDRVFIRRCFGLGGSAALLLLRISGSGEADGAHQKCGRQKALTKGGLHVLFP